MKSRLFLFKILGCVAVFNNNIPNTPSNPFHICDVCHSGVYILNANLKYVCTLTWPGNLHPPPET